MNDQFEVKLEEGSDRKFLIPTAEVILTNIVRNTMMDLKFYLRFVASTPVLKEAEAMEKIQKE